MGLYNNCVYGRRWCGGLRTIVRRYWRIYIAGGRCSIVLLHETMTDSVQ